MKKFIITSLILFSFATLSSFSANSVNTSVQIHPIYKCKDGNTLYTVSDFSLQLDKCKNFKARNNQTAYQHCMAEYNKHLSLYKSGKCKISASQLITNYNDTICSMTYSKTENSINGVLHRCTSQKACDSCFMKLAKFVKAKHPDVHSSNEDLIKYGIKYIPITTNIIP
ncbi:hypothetical protein HDR58_10505 [bacterium]|nr:hypothetical protein [bacterium]